MQGLSRLEELTERLGLVETLLADLDATVIASETGEIVYANANAAKMLHYDSPAEIIGQELRELMPERYRLRHDTAFRARVERGEGDLLGRSVAVSALRKDGSEVAVHLWLQEQTIAGEKYYVGVLRLTELIVTLKTEEIVSVEEDD